MKQLHIRISDNLDDCILGCIKDYKEIHKISCSKQDMINLLLDKGMDSLRKDFQVYFQPDPNI